jgi:hypothetical protein
MIWPKTKEFFQKLTVSPDVRSPSIRRTPASSTYITAAAAAAAAAAAPARPAAEDSSAAGGVSGRYTYQGGLEALVLKWSEVNVCNHNYFNAEQVGSTATALVKKA